MEIDRRVFIASPWWHSGRQPDGFRGQGRQPSSTGWKNSSTSRSPPRRARRRSFRLSPRLMRRSKRATIAAASAALRPLQPRQRQRASSRCRSNPTIQDFFRLRFAARQSRAAERDARVEDRHVRGSDARLPAARLRAEPDQAGSRLVGRAAVRALHPRKVDLRDPLSLRRCGSIRTRMRVTNIRTSTSGSSARTTNRQPHIEATYKMLLTQKRDMEPRLVTVND